MSVLAEFFRGSETRIGVFSPKRYLLAVYPDVESALRAARTLRDAGFPGQDVVAVPGEDMVQLAREELQRKGFWVLLTHQLSRMLGTEESYTDHDLALAREGAGFLVAYCPTQSDKRRVWRILEETAPVVARHYGSVAIDHLRGET